MNSINCGDHLNFEHVEGNDKGKITLYALSTCIWCKKTKDLLSDLGAKYDYAYVDLLKGHASTRAISSTTLPREVFIRIEVGFILASWGLPLYATKNTAVAFSYPKYI